MPVHVRLKCAYCLGACYAVLHCATVDSSISQLQVATGRAVDAGWAALLTAGVTLAIDSRAQPLATSRQAPLLAAASRQQEARAPPAGQWATAQRLWGNWPALSATLLLMLDAATPLVTHVHCTQRQSGGAKGTLLAAAASNLGTGLDDVVSAGTDC
jgi:hypothetical protein